MREQTCSPQQTVDIIKTMGSAHPSGSILDGEPYIRIVLAVRSVTFTGQIAPSCYYGYILRLLVSNVHLWLRCRVNA